MVLEKKEEVIHGGLQREGAAPSLSVSIEKSRKKQGPRAFQAGLLEGGKSFRGLLMPPSTHRGSLLFDATAPC